MSWKKTQPLLETLEKITEYNALLIDSSLLRLPTFNESAELREAWVAYSHKNTHLYITEDTFRNLLGNSFEPWRRIMGYAKECAQMHDQFPYDAGSTEELLAQFHKSDHIARLPLTYRTNPETKQLIHNLCMKKVPASSARMVLSAHLFKKDRPKNQIGFISANPRTEIAYRAIHQVMPQHTPDYFSIDPDTIPAFVASELL